MNLDFVISIQFETNNAMEPWKVFNEKFQLFMKYFCVTDLLHWLRFLTDLAINFESRFIFNSVKESVNVSETLMEIKELIRKAGIIEATGRI